MPLHITQLQTGRKAQNTSIPEHSPSIPNASTDSVKDLLSEGGICTYAQDIQSSIYKSPQVTNKQQIIYMVLYFSFVYGGWGGGEVNLAFFYSMKGQEMYLILPDSKFYS